jgi:hypothetical protein
MVQGVSLALLVSLVLEAGKGYQARQDAYRERGWQDDRDLWTELTEGRVSEREVVPP